MATIIQRAVQNEVDDGNFGMTEEEKQQLLNEVKKFGEDKKKK
jgi:bifunctional pyridoxal-dependent enzyme with beta-cystathionase and maltose regulon repressor activities